ncbi:PRC-barrel domain-containing protein [Salipiger bermudensis]|uniref:PRC-barrel domain-containing protein n=1 Tax=Salipiger bermudensis TaxID=344736 RepID=UPI001CD6BFEF|nr:PRC-barrel domain-containing protein [Salipiger bermudensis]MCA0963335.1 PRC-barrel domain-containing protein [Salipiger bermudensis]
MLFSLTDLLSWPVQTGDQSGTLSDVLFDPETRQLTHLALHTRGALDGAALANASRLEAPDAENRRLAVAISDEELAAAPHWQGDTRELDALLTAMPPLVVGPFGATHAPLALGGFLGTRPDGTETDPRAEAVIDRHQRFSRWRDRAVFTRDAEIGTLRDMLYNAEANRIDYLVVDDGKWIGGKKYALPFSSLAHRAPGNKGGHLVLDLAEHDLVAAPAPEDLLDPARS